VASAVLAQMEGRGHGCLPLASLPSARDPVSGWPIDAREQLMSLWQALPATLEGWRDDIAASPVVQRIGRDPDQGQPLVLDGPDEAPQLYLRRYWQYECSVSAAIAARLTHDGSPDTVQLRSWLERLFPKDPARAPAFDWQKAACAIAVRGRLAIVTGGPGTGKTYTAARLLALLFATHDAPDGLRVALAAPTGKAAARLKQAIDLSLQQLQRSIGNTIDLGALIARVGAARTVHSLLGARPDTRRFAHHAGRPLDVDVVIVDEVSMVHLEMMTALLDALPPASRLILLGDKDQLASVEAGAVLGDLCQDSRAGRYRAATARYLREATGEELPAEFLADTLAAPALAQQTVMLRESRRFHGPIGQLAQAVNELADAERARQLLARGEGGALFASEDGRLASAIELAVRGRQGAPACYRDYLRLLRERRAGDRRAAGDHVEWASAVLKAFEGIRVLCAVRDGAWGVTGLNAAIERALAEEGLLSPRGSWYAGRPIIVSRNDPSLGVFNGDVGITLPSADSGRGLRVWFRDADRLRSVSVSRLAHAETAFAMTVHKSQGSEFEHTVLVLAASGGQVLSRELLYTGITRARSAFSLVSESPELLGRAILQPTVRQSGLTARLAADTRLIGT
jgi:exodeoxyribonuclease V alpha subunit